MKVPDTIDPEESTVLGRGSPPVIDDQRDAMKDEDRARVKHTNICIHQSDFVHTLIEGIVVDPVVPRIINNGG